MDDSYLNDYGTELEEVWEDADDYTDNAPCDNSGFCVGSTCKYFAGCKG